MTQLNSTGRSQSRPAVPKTPTLPPHLDFEEDDMEEANYIDSDRQTRKQMHDLDAFKPLVQLLASDDLDVLSNTASALKNCAISAENAHSIRECGGLDNLVILLTSDSHEVQANAAGVIMNIAANDEESREILEENGGLEALVDLLKSPSVAVLLYVTGSIFHLCLRPENAVSIRKLEGVQPILTLLGHENEEVAISAASSLSRCVEVDELCRGEVATLGGLVPVIQLMQDYNDILQVRAAEIIDHIASNDDHLRLAVREHDGISPLLDLLTSPIDDVQAAAAGALHKLAANPKVAVTIREMSGVQYLVNLLSSGKDFVQIPAVGALMHGAEFDPSTRDEIRSQGALQDLVAFLGSRNVELQARSANTLFHCGQDERNKADIRELGGLKALIMLVVPDTDADLLSAVTGALMVLMDGDELNRNVVRKLNGIKRLIQQLQTAKDPRVIARSSGALYNISQSPSSLVDIRVFDGFPQLIELLTAKNKSAKLDAIGVLGNCASDETNRKFILKLNGIRPIFGLFTSRDEEMLRRASKALRNASLSYDCAVEMRKVGLSPLVSMITKDNPEIVTEAMAAIANCAQRDDDMIMDAVKLKLFTPTVKLLSHEREDIVASAASALMNFGTVDINTAEIVELDGCAKLVDNLRSNNYEILKFSLGALANVTGRSDHSRTEIRDMNALGSVVARLDASVGGDGVTAHSSTGRSISFGNTTGGTHMSTTGSGANIRTVSRNSTNTSNRSASAASHNARDDASDHGGPTEADSVLVLLHALATISNCALNMSVRRSIGRENGCLEALTQLIVHPLNQVKVVACAAAANTIADEEENILKWNDIGGVKHTLYALDCDSTEVQRRACVLFAHSGYLSVAANAIGDIGGIRRCVELLDSPSLEVRTEAAGAIMSCTTTTYNRTNLREQDGLEPLVNLLTNSDEERSQYIDANVCGAIMNSAIDVENRLLLRKFNVLQPLVSMLEVPNPKLCALVAGALAHCNDSSEKKGDTGDGSVVAQTPRSSTAMGGAATPRMDRSFGATTPRGASSMRSTTPGSVLNRTPSRAGILSPRTTPRTDLGDSERLAKNVGSFQSDAVTLEAKKAPIVYDRSIIKHAKLYVHSMPTF